MFVHFAWKGRPEMTYTVSGETLNLTSYSLTPVAEVKWRTNSEWAALSRVVIKRAVGEWRQRLPSSWKRTFWAHRWCDV